MKRRILIIIGIISVALVIFFAVRSFVLRQVVDDLEDFDIDESKQVGQVAVSGETEIPDLTVIKFAHDLPESHPQHIALTQVFVPYVEKASDWSIRVEVYSDGELGSEEEFIQGLSKGTVEMCLGRQSLMEVYPKLMITELPYLFEDYSQVIEVLNGDIGDEITDDMTALGVRCLGWSLNGFRQVSMTETGEDMAGRRIATSRFEFNQNALREMGFDVVGMDEKKTSLALGQNLIDGHDYPLIIVDNFQWNEYQEKMILTKHHIDTDMYMVSEEFWAGLSADDRQVLIEGTNKSIEYEVELIESTEEQILRRLQDEGVAIQEYDKSSINEQLIEYNESKISEDEVLMDIYSKIRAFTAEN